jgi:hypothetical protein
MNKKALAGIGGAAVVAIAVVLYLVLSGGGSGVGGGDPKVAKQRADLIFADLVKQGGKATYKSAEAPGEKLILKDVVVTPKASAGKPAVELKIAELRINRLDWKNPKSSAYGDVEIKRMTSSAFSQNPQAKEFLSAAGLKDFVLNGKYVYSYDKAKKLLETQAFDTSVDGMGTLSIKIKMDGIDIEQMRKLTAGGKPQMGQLMGLAGALRLHVLSISFKDAGGTVAIQKYAAKKQKVSADDVKKMALTQIENRKKAMPFQLGKEALEAAEKFIKNPGEIFIKAEPSAPVAILAVVMGTMGGGMNPAKIDALKKTLGISIGAK